MSAYKAVPLRPRQKLEALKAAGVELVEGDVTQPATLPAAVEGVDIVLSCLMVRLWLPFGGGERGVGLILARVN
jgi:uncharacterized protein YbjT (DUF2867 family)